MSGTSHFLPLPPLFYEKAELTRLNRSVNFEPDEWQVRVLDNVDADKSMLIVAPTSSGKTFISFAAMERVLRESDEGVGTSPPLARSPFPPATDQLVVLQLSTLLPRRLLLIKSLPSASLVSRRKLLVSRCGLSTPVITASTSAFRPLTFLTILQY
jgi:hypothetical protein